MALEVLKDRKVITAGNSNVQLTNLFASMVSPRYIKKHMSVRPTMSSIGTISYECARYLATVLSPMVGTTQHHVKNRKGFAEEETKIEVEPAQRDEIICCLSRMDDTKLAMRTSKPQKTSSDCWSCA